MDDLRADDIRFEDSELVEAALEERARRRAMLDGLYAAYLTGRRGGQIPSGAEQERGCWLAGVEVLLWEREQEAAAGGGDEGGGSR